MSSFRAGIQFKFDISILQLSFTLETNHINRSILTWNLPDIEISAHIVLIHDRNEPPLRGVSEMREPENDYF